MPQLLDMILDGKLDTTFLISHRLDLEDAPEGYKKFKEKQNEYTKVVLKPTLHAALRQPAAFKLPRANRSELARTGMRAPSTS